MVIFTGLTSSVSRVTSTVTLCVTETLVTIILASFVHPRICLVGDVEVWEPGTTNAEEVSSDWSSTISSWHRSCMTRHTYSSWCSLTSYTGHDLATERDRCRDRKFLGTEFPEIVSDQIGVLLGLHDPIIYNSGLVNTSTVTFSESLLFFTLVLF